MNGGAYMIQVKKWRLVFVCLVTLCACLVLQAQDRTIVISGTVVTPDKVLNKGWVVIKHKKISAVSDTLPTEENAIWVDTNDIIFPGFIDLHNHPMYAMFEPMGRQATVRQPVSMAFS
jgi:imidazolonepropionase-like amidohydrolase